MIEILILAAVRRRSVDGQIGQARRVGIIIYGVPEILITRELGGLAELPADQHVDSHGQGFGHSICCGIAKFR